MFHAPFALTLDEAVSQRRFAVIDMGDDAKIANLFRRQVYGDAGIARTVSSG